jgi:hypothetical protein
MGLIGLVTDTSPSIQVSAVVSMAQRFPRALRGSTETAVHEKKDKALKFDRG